MMHDTENTGGEAKFRKKAEEILLSDEKPVVAQPHPRDDSTLLHELQVHQVELELQNEELRRTQEELEQSRARYYELYEMAPVGYLTLNESGIILEANLTAAEMLGIERRILPGNYLTRYIFPNDQDIFYRQRRTLVEYGTQEEAEFRIVRPGGFPLWVRMRGNASEDSEGKLQLRIIVSDITEQKRAEESLWESETKYRTIFENAPLGFFRSTPQGRLFDANTAMAEMFGYTSSEAMLRLAPNINTELCIKSEERKSTQWETMRARGVTLQANSYQRADGSEFLAHVNLKIMCDSGGHPLYCEGIIEDVTENKRLQSELGKAEKSCRMAPAVIDAADAVITMSPDGKIIGWNPAAEKNYGWSEHEALKMNIRDLVPANLRGQELGTLEVLCRVDTLEPYATSRIARNGKKIDVWVTAVSLFNEVGEFYAITTHERPKTGKR